MIKKFWKIFLIAFFVLFLVGVGVFSWQQKDQQVVIAQNFGVTGPARIICEEPIPIGIAIDNTVDILDQVYQAYKNESGKTAKEAMASLTRTINEKGEGKVCDFNGQCSASIYAAGPNLAVMAKLLPGMKKGEKIQIGSNIPPICESMGDKAVNKNDCVGNPCPSLSQFIKKPNGNVPDDTLEGFKRALTTQADNIHALFDGKNKVVIGAIAEPGETPGFTKISDVDFVKRYINYIDEAWLTPNAEGSACVLSKLERERVAQGLMGEKYPKSCLSALADMTYSPKPWSEECVDECQSGDLSDECRSCLAQCKGTSVFAKINCKLYSKGDGGQNEEVSSCNYNNATLCGEDSQCIWGQNPNDNGTKKDVCVTIKTVDRQNENTTCDQCDNETDCTKGCEGEVGLGGCEWKSVDVLVPSTCYAVSQLPLGTSENEKCAIKKGASKKCCGSECEDGLNAACYSCLCPKGPKEATTEECLDWICGGSKSNWVCCHEQPIETPLYYVEDDTTEPDAIWSTNPDDEMVDGKHFETRISTYVDNIQKTSSGVVVQRGVMASATSTLNMATDFQMLPFGTCVKVREVTNGVNDNVVPARILPSSIYDNNVATFVNDKITSNGQYFCITDRGGAKIKSGERFDIWLDKNDSTYIDYSNAPPPAMDFGLQWGVRNSKITFWYDPGKSCYAGRDKPINLDACKRATPLTKEQVTEGVKAGDLKHFKMGWGYGNQWGDASEPLTQLLSCIDSKLSDGDFAMISSISDSAGIELCGDAGSYSKPPCAHEGADSCHYGGLQSKKVTEGATITDPLNWIKHLKSVAADISKTRSSSGVALKAAQAAACCGSLGGYQVTAMEESDHYHISVAVKKNTLGYEMGMLADKKDKNYYDCDYNFRTSTKQSQNVISCPTK